MLHSALAQGVVVSEQPELAGYRKPDRCLQSLVDAPRPPGYFSGPRRQTIAVVQMAGRPDLGSLGSPRVRLAGLQIDPERRAGAVPAFSNELSLLSMGGGRPRAVRGLPAASRIAHLEFSPDERWLALSLWEGQRVTLWLVDVRTALARRLLARPLNTVVSTGFGWLAGSKTLFVSLQPLAGRPGPAAVAAPVVPAISESETGRLRLIRSGADTLKTSHDADLLDWYLERQMAAVEVSGQVRLIGKPERLLAAIPSPDGKYVLASRVRRPYAPNAGLLQLPRSTEVWDSTGRRLRVLHESEVWSRPNQERDTVPPGPRDFGWRADSAHTVYWTSALDEGDAARDAEARDGLFALEASSPQDGVLLARFNGRIRDVAWGNAGLALLTETWWKQRVARTWRLRPGEPGSAPALLSSRDPEDRAGDPGRPLRRVLENGERVLLTDDGNDAAYFAGAGGDGDRPTLNRLRLSDGEVTTLWRSQAPHHERVLTLLDTHGPRFVTERQGRHEPPNLYLHEGAAAPLALTHVGNPVAWSASVEMRELRYQRADGIALSGKLYLPPGYDRARMGPIPALIWAYPQESGSRSAASRMMQSPYTFAPIDPLSPLAMLCLGYAVLDNPAMPIVGEQGAAPNDSHVGQLVASAQAAVDALVATGMIERRRIAIGGHSYGASMAANLLAHSDLFAAGIAQSGAYNRSLTPFGFQWERRTFWQAPAVYQAMSPFNHANVIDKPLLLIHGQSDANPGTTPLQSELLFQALSSLGRTARLVTLPREDHVYRARETILHVLWEQERWLERHLKQMPTSPGAVSGTD